MASQEKSRPARMGGQQLKFDPTVTGVAPTRVETKDQFVLWRRVEGRLDWRCPACGEPHWIEGALPGRVYLVSCPACGEGGRLQTYPGRCLRCSAPGAVELDAASRAGQFFAEPEPVAAPETAASAPEPPAAVEQGDGTERPARRPCRPAVDRKKARQRLKRDTIRNWLNLESGLRAEWAQLFRGGKGAGACISAAAQALQIREPFLPENRRTAGQRLTRDTVANWLRQEPSLRAEWAELFGGSKGAGSVVVAAAHALQIREPFLPENRRTLQRKPGYTLAELKQCLEYCRRQQSAAATPVEAPAAAVEAALAAFARAQIPVVRLALRGPLRIEDGVLRVGTICGSDDHAEIVAAQLSGSLNDSTLAPLVTGIEVRGPGVTLSWPYPAPEPGQQQEAAA